jgi:3-oxoacyl-[acyl-carrier-protein] synthase II
MMDAARVVVTGMGAMSPLGLNVDQMWAGLVAGRCGIDRIKAFDPKGMPCEFAGEVPPYSIQDCVPRKHRKAVKLMCRDIELAVIAAQEAFVASGLITKGIDPDHVTLDPTRTAITLGAGMISCDMAELGPAVAASTTDGRFDIQKWGKQGLDLITPLWLLKYLPNMLACHVGIIHDIQGPSNTLTCAEASSHLAIGEAAQIIARGDSDVAVAGGAEARVNLMMLLRQCLLRRAACNSRKPASEMCRPFDTEAEGSVFGEGAGVVILENLEHARKRGAKIMAEVVGIGQSHSLSTAPQHLEPDGAGVRIAVEKAMADAGVTTDELDLIVPHGIGVIEDDLAEAKGIQSALGPGVEKIAVWPTKSMLSTTGAAGGALDVVAAVRAIVEGVIPSAKNFDKPAEGCRLNVATKRHEGPIRHVLCCSYTFGGQTAAIVLKAFDAEATQ